MYYVLTDSEGGAGAGLLADGNAVPGDGGVWLGEEALLHALPRTLAIAQHLHSVLLIVLCSAPSVPQPVVQSRRRPLLGPSPG